MNGVTIATINFKDLERYDFNERFDWLESIIIENLSNDIDVDIYVLPAQFLYIQDSTKEFFEWAIEGITSLLTDLSCKSVICLGFDGLDGDEQLGIACNKDSCLAVGRKFHHMKDSISDIVLSKSFLELENGYSRVFELKGIKFYIAVCYDIYGINHNEIENPGIDVILNVIHGFGKSGAGSDESGFARKGLAGASQRWKCPVFGAANFTDRAIAENWPTGVFFDDSTVKRNSLTYEDIRIEPIGVYTREGKESHMKLYKV